MNKHTNKRLKLVTIVTAIAIVMAVGSIMMFADIKTPVLAEEPTNLEHPTANEESLDSFIDRIVVTSANGADLLPLLVEDSKIQSLTGQVVGRLGPVEDGDGDVVVIMTATGDMVTYPTSSPVHMGELVTIYALVTY